MDKDEFTKYLEERYNDQVKWYDRKSGEAKRYYSWLQTTLIVLAAATPILVALDKAGPPALRWAALAASAVVAVLTAFLKTFKFEENWINYRTTCELLKKEIHLCRAAVGDYANASDRQSRFVERVETLVSRENALWVSIEKTRDGQTTKERANQADKTNEHP